MTSSEYLRFMRDVVEDVPVLRPLLEEHLRDQDGELLPHLLMFDVYLWWSSTTSPTAQRYSRCWTAWLS